MYSQKKYRRQTSIIYEVIPYTCIVYYTYVFALAPRNRRFFFFIIISAPPEMKAGLSKQRKFVKIQKNYFFVPQWLFRSLRVLLWIWISVFLKKRPFEYLPWYTRKRTIFGAALKGENLSCCCYINVGGFKCIYI